MQGRYVNLPWLQLWQFLSFDLIVLILAELTRPLPFQVLSTFMIHYVQLALSALCAPSKGEALLCWTFFSADSTLIATL